MSGAKSVILECTTTPSLRSSVVLLYSRMDRDTNNQTVTVSTAGIRALVYQMQALYLRTPVKLFRPSRFDYLAYAREVANKHDNIASKPYSIRTHSSVGMLVTAIRKEGWRFIPDQLMPPLIANLATGVILYGTYLTALDQFKAQGPLSHADYWRAGFVAGFFQSLAAAPIDAIYTRSLAAEVLSGNHTNLWRYGIQKLREIGLLGVFAGYGFSLIKESLGFAFYFSTFEMVKTKGYDMSYWVIRSLNSAKVLIKRKLSLFVTFEEEDPTAAALELRKTTKLLKSTFVLVAGASAAFSLLAVQYPLTKIQKVHLLRLEALDIYNASRHTSRPFIKLYYNSYIDTYRQVVRMKDKSRQSWFTLGYKGFVRNALTTIPATLVGLLVFEIMRLRLAD